MAQGLYQTAKVAILGGLVDFDTDDIRAILIDATDYTVNLTTHEFLTDVPAAAREETVALTGKAILTAGAFDSDSPTFSSTTGDACDAVLLYVHTGSDATARLLYYDDTLSGLPVTLGGDVTINVDVAGWFAL